jgi:hypothetical protein
MILLNAQRIIALISIKTASHRTREAHVNISGLRNIHVQAHTIALWTIPAAPPQELPVVQAQVAQAVQRHQPVAVQTLISAIIIL